MCRVYLNGKAYDEYYDAESAFLSYTSIRFWMNVRIEKEFFGPYVDPYYVSRIHQLIARSSE